MKQRVERQVGEQVLFIETGFLAKQAAGSVLVGYGDTRVLVATATGAPRPGIDFFPLTCDYREKYPAVGRFPGGFRTREGAPNEKEVLTMRMIDRPIRPLFPEGFLDEIQLQTIVLSHDGQTDADVIACTAASAALSITDAPFQGPVAT
ncbi:MAG: polyribonucleotide nucleotidyltransferase, partial [Planctomycetia bacterium]